METGVQVSSFTWPGGDAAIAATFGAIAEAADAAGFDSFWVMDHFFQIASVGAYDEPMLEAYAALSFAAARTKTITLGTLVTGVLYRTAGLLAKTVTTLDVLSEGRAWLGIGAGWNEQEALALGFGFPPVGERFERLEETLAICRQMWAGDRAPFEGRHYTLTEPLNSPQAISKPQPKIMVGGMGERKTLRLVARYADACNLFPVGTAAVRAKLDILKRHCDEAGRDYGSISKTLLMRADPLGEPAEAIVGRCREYAAIGIDHVIFSVANTHQIEPLDVMGRDVLPAVAEI